PRDVLAQLGNRVQHALRAYTPDDAKALRATVSTFPHSSYDLEEVLTSLGIGEAVVTVLSERGAPTPVAWTRMRAPQSLMAPSPASVVDTVIAASALRSEYAEAVDRESAYERLAARLAAVPADPSQAPAPVPSRAPSDAGWEPPAPAPGPATTVPTGLDAMVDSPVFKSFARAAATVVGRELTRSIFGVGRRGRRRRRR
ncbi:MAG TPA: helicase HerA-like domain-containing protein, partial [Actinomycetes bacterium]|nr:helicase HerA-like domain-containing protein [Actinomycetes bacterium]